ncbi:chorismate mutase [Schaalia sp. 19OD2882]|uniref:chorismate mutase n=1 Tax=Schaalia sp. 19OD2882 TaxID=2794089 RepID=UPI001C1ED614|nr:chorismate mutase [Schaalia sp. 19OD2882]QWW19062.1 chorismate mutase [Schaalia sp. 19OD2882]
MGDGAVASDPRSEDIRGLGEGLPAELLEARATIDNIDAALIHILAERFRCTQRVGHIKARHDMPPADPARERRQVRRMRALAESAGLDPDFAEKFLSFMVTEVIRHHEDIKQGYRMEAAAQAKEG